MRCFYAALALAAIVVGAAGCSRSLSPDARTSLVPEDPASPQMKQENFQALAQAIAQRQDIDRFLSQEPSLARKTWAGTTMLYSAAMFDNADAAKSLIAHGADPNFATPLGETPLDRAVSSRAQGVIDVLSQHGARRGRMR